jgi:plastocyanin
MIRMNKLLFLSPLLLLAIIPFAFADHTAVEIETVEESGFSQDCASGDGCYIESTTTVDVGAHVTMTNTDTTGVHTFTSGTVDGFTPSPSEIFDSGILASGESIEWIPDTAGEVPYYCMLHTWMIGTIIVDEEVEEIPVCVGCSMEDAREIANEELEEFTISVWTDKTDYDHNDMIIVKGQVSDVSGFPITITVISPLNSLLTLDQLTVANDGSFETTINTVGSEWKYDGTYTIKASYGSDEKSNEIKIELVGGSTVTPPSEEEHEPTTEPACGPGTIFDEQTNSCILHSEPTRQQESKPIPVWVKGIFLFWANDEISDAELTSAITFLVESGIIILDN